MDNWVTTHQMLIFPAVHINIRCVCVFCIQSLCHHTVRGCCQRADSIGLSRALDIVFMKGEGQKATEVSWEFSTHTHSKFVPFVSNVHLVMHLTSCFPPLDDFQNPGLTNTQMYMLSEQTAHIKTREHGVKEAHSTDEANISWCCHTQNFPDCATENNNVVNTNTELRFRANTFFSRHTTGHNQGYIFECVCLFHCESYLCFHSCWRTQGKSEWKVALTSSNGLEVYAAAFLNGELNECVQWNDQTNFTFFSCHVTFIFVGAQVHTPTQRGLCNSWR